jgi:hypothetical protein
VYTVYTCIPSMVTDEYSIALGKICAHILRHIDPHFGLRICAHILCHIEGCAEPPSICYHIVGHMRAYSLS